MVVVGDKVVNKAFRTKKNGKQWIWEVEEVKGGVVRILHMVDKAKIVIWCKLDEVEKVAR